jgi:adenylate cyclase class 2
MSVEVEAKLKVDSIEEVRERLMELRAEYVAELGQVDILFDDKNDTLTKADSCVRLRRQTRQGETKYILTYKGAKEKSSFKRRREIEIEVSDADATLDILSALGYYKKLTVEKKRSLWRFGECEIALDQVKQLGDFVEIEGPNETIINNMQKILNLGHLSHIPKSYASLIADKIKGNEEVSTEHAR